jgi:radical SAM protein with 4Fe4S-binding SPASM domain
MKIEPTNICNTKCQLCPTGVGLQGRPKGTMKFEQFQKLINRLKHHLVTLDLSMWGDPLIVPDIYKMIRYAHDKRIWTYISSNLHAFKPGKGQAEQLVRSGLNLMTCSLHGASQQTYEIYQPGKRLDECIAKIRQIIATRDRMNSATPAIQLNFVVTRYNEHERDAFQKLADELGCAAIFSTASMNVRFAGQDQKLTDLGLSSDLKKKLERDHVAKWLPENQKFVIDPYRQILQGNYDPDVFNGSKLYDCEWPWRSAVINWDGNVVVCCGSFDPAKDMGSVFDQRFGKIWNSEKYRLARRSYRKRLTADKAQDNPCASCPGFLI